MFQHIALDEARAHEKSRRQFPRHVARVRSARVPYCLASLRMYTSPLHGGLAIPAAFNKARKAATPKAKRSPKLDTDIDGFLNRVISLAKDSSINDFANQTNTNAETVRRYLRKISVPDVGFAIRLSRRLKISPDWLLTGKGNGKSTGK